jgi:hypothetical protein
MAEPALNDRQRAYLQAIFDTDQAVEVDMRAIPFSPFQDRPKASEWRWMEYSEPIPIINKPASRLYAAIKAVAKIDQGTGSTFTALADRGFIQVTERGPSRYPHIRVTPAGRKLVRSWTGAKAYKAPPTGTLQEWHWRALAKVYVVGDAGLPDSDNWIGPRTWRRLEDYKSGALVELRRDSQDYWHWRYYVTSAGKTLYEREWVRYRDMYPDVDAPEPRVTAETRA